MRTIAYRLRSPVGGLAADLTAEARPLAQDDVSHVHIHNGVRLLLPTEGIYWKDAAWLALGVSLNARAMAAKNPTGTTIRVISLEAPLSDYRSEVAALAMNAWCIEEFELETNDVLADFDPVADDYMFTWNGATNPFGDPFDPGA
ncbi:hypothetical protein [Streptomyces anandii]|uniref:hypothetical protein n=1 Tax=Streptomyces anandii TaxID=285454 RepID=UPI0036D207DF